MSMSWMRVLTAVSALGLLGACAHRHAPVYEESPTLAGSRLPAAQTGYIQSIETVDARQSTTGGGAVLGAVVGGVIGRQFGSSGDGRAVGTMAGVVGGALIGNEIEKQQSNTPDRYRVQVRMDNGYVRSFNHAQIGDLRVGDRVRVEGKGLVRF